MAIAAGSTGLRAAAVAQTRIEGTILLHPSFSGEVKVDGEDEEYRASVKKRWTVIFPGARGGLDDPRMNPLAAGAPSLSTLPGERMLVCAASEDPRMPRERAYYEAVNSSGWRGDVEWFESEGKGHGFFVEDHGCRQAVALMERVVDFLAGH
jgi:acetyl esterase/lipase